MLFKNIAGQGLYLFAYDTVNNIAKTGDAANITASISKDGGSNAATATVNPTSIGGGIYWQPLSQAETNANAIAINWTSTTTGIQIDPVLILTNAGVVPSVAPGSAGGLLTFGTGTGQINPTSGKVPATLANADIAGNIAVDLQTIKGQTITCAAGVTVLASVGTATVSSPQTGDVFTRIGVNGAGLTAVGLAGTQSFNNTGQTTVLPANTTQFAGQAVILDANNYPGVNIVDVAGQTATSSGGTVDANIVSINGTTFTGTTTPDTAGTGTLLTRLTALRSGYLDNLNVGGNVASHADILSLNTATGRAVLITSGQYLKPASGSTLYPVTLILTNLEGVPEDADGSLTNVITNGAGTDRSANFSGWTHATTGRYEGTYSVASSATDEPLVLRISGTVGGQAFVAVSEPVVADAFALAFNSTDRTNLNALVAVAPAHTPVIDTNGAISVNNLPTDYQQRGVAVILPSGGVVLATSQPNYAPLTTLGTNAPANWINAAAIAANALNGKGDWPSAGTISTAVLTNATDINTVNSLGSVITILNGLVASGDHTQLTAHALALAPAASGSGGTITVGGYATGQDPATLLSAVGYTTARANNLDHLNADITSRSTYSGADTSGTTTLLTRLPAALTITNGNVAANAVQWGGTNVGGMPNSTTPPTVTQIDTQLSNTHGSGAWSGGTVTGYATGEDPVTLMSAAGYTTARANKLDNLDTNVGSRSIYNGGPVSTVTDKTGYSLAATGLDAIPIADPGGVANHNTFTKMMIAVYRYLYKKRTLTATQLKTYADDGTTVNTTQGVSDDGTTQTQGTSS